MKFLFKYKKIFQNEIFLQKHVFSLQYYICIDKIYIKGKFGIKISHIIAIY